jgi:hypothetical protein
MRNLLMAGTAGLFLALGAASAYAVPQNSPYATMAPPGAVDGYTQGNGPMYNDEPMVEGRSAYVDPDYGYSDPGYADPAYVYPDDGYSAGGPIYFGGGGGGRHFGGGHFGGNIHHNR